MSAVLLSINECVPSLVTYLQLLLFYFFNLEILILDQHGVDSKLQQELAFLPFSSND